MPLLGLLAFLHYAGRFAFAAVCAAIFGVLLYSDILWAVSHMTTTTVDRARGGVLVLVGLASIAVMFDLATSTAREHGPWHRASLLAILVLVLFIVGPFEVSLLRLGVPGVLQPFVLGITGLSASILIINSFSALNRRAGWPPPSDAKENPHA